MGIYVYDGTRKLRATDWNTMQVVVENIMTGHDHDGTDSKQLLAEYIPSLPASKITSETFAVARGGTGLSSLATGGILYISATNTLSRIAPSAANKVLRSTAANALELGSLVVGDLPTINDSVHGTRGSALHGEFVQYLPDILTDSASTQTVTTGRCYLMPIVIPVKCTISAVAVIFDSNATGNLYVGIYADSGGSPASQALQAQSNSTAGAGTYQHQEVALTSSIQLNPGVYHVAIHTDNATMVMGRPSSKGYAGGTYHGHYFDQTYGSLPSTCPAVINGVCLSAKLLVVSVP